jgi:uncharacterized phage protein (TIGR02218 family)
MTFLAAELSTYNNSPLELYLFTTLNGGVWAYTNGTKEQTRGSQVYAPAPISRNAVDTNPGEAPKMLEITLPENNALIAQFIPYLPVTPIAVTVYRRHFTDPDNEFAIVFTGSAASVRFDNGAAVLSCRPVAASIGRKAPWQTYQAPCNWALYSLGCGIPQDDYKVTGTVTSVSNFDILCTAAGTKPDGWFTTGFVRRDSTGEVRWITAHTGATITLQKDFQGLEGGEAISIFAGCDRLETTCAVKFNNKLRFLGWPDVPTKNPFSDNVFGTGSSGGSGSVKDIPGIERYLRGSS